MTITKENAAADAAFYAWLVAEHAEDSIVVTDVAGRVVWVNAAFSALSGYSADEMRGKKPGDILQGAETDPETVKAISHAIRKKLPIHTELLNYTKTGEAYWIELKIKPIYNAKGLHTHFISIERDVTNRRKMETRMRASLASEKRRRDERRLLTQVTEWFHAANSMDDLVRFITDSMKKVFPGTEGELFLYSNSRDVLDLSTSWGHGQSADHVAPDECWALRRGRAYRYGFSDIEFSCAHVEASDPSAYFCLPLIAHGETLGLLHLRFKDTNDREATQFGEHQTVDDVWQISIMLAEQISLAVANAKLRQELQDQSTRDPLTGLWNRRWFWDAGRKQMDRAMSRGEEFSIISLDIDHFKKFNDHHGHDAGDRVLREIGKLMQTVFTDGKSACRIGGEEFTIVLPGLSEIEAADCAEAFRLAASDIVVVHDSVELPKITVSMGVASLTAGHTDLNEIVKLADQALYAAKAQGRDAVVLASDLDPERQIIAAE